LWNNLRQCFRAKFIRRTRPHLSATLHSKSAEFSICAGFFSSIHEFLIHFKFTPPTQIEQLHLRLNWNNIYIKWAIVTYTLVFFRKTRLGYTRARYVHLLTRYNVIIIIRIIINNHFRYCAYYKKNARPLQLSKANVKPT